jgi:hypothetical protein
MFNLSAEAPLCLVCKAHLTRVGCLPVIVTIVAVILVMALIATLFPAPTASKGEFPWYMHIMVVAGFVLSFVVGFTYRRIIWPRQHKNHASLDGPITSRLGGPGEAFITFANDRYASMFLEHNHRAKLCE